MTNNNSILLSDRVGVNLVEAIANLELLKNSLEVQEKSMEAEKAKLAADRQQLEAEKTQVSVSRAHLKAAHLQLEVAKSQLERAQTQLSEARAVLETSRTHLEVAMAELCNDKTRMDAVRASLEDAKLKIEAATKQLNAAKSRFEASKIQLDATTANVAADKLGLEDKNAKLQMKVSQLENDKSKLEAEQKQSKVEIQSLHDKVKELEKQSNGKKTHMIPARKLGIDWSEAPEYWIWKSVPDSIYEVAELLSVCWLAIYGRLQTSELAPNTTYAAYFVFKLKDNHSGFNNPEGKGYVGVAGREKSINNLSLIAEGKRRQDGWMEVELGQFYVKENDDEMEIDFTQITSYWKSGLVVQGIEVRAM